MSPAINPVTAINKYGEPPKGNNEATLTANTPSFFIFIQRANPPHNKNKPKNPERNAFHGF